MLPSTGLFKSISCPYYHGGGSNASGVSCYRPFCHFKHLKKDEVEPPKAIQTAPVPEYRPAPKLMKLAHPTIRPSAKKKRNLEYCPDKPELNHKSSRRHASVVPAAESTAPVYVPSNTINLDDCTEELDELTEIFDAQLNDETLVNPDLCHAVAENIAIPEEKEEEEQNQIIKEEPGNELVLLKNIKQEQPDAVDEIQIKIEKTDFTESKVKTEKCENSASLKSVEKCREERRDSTASTNSSRHKHKSSTSGSREHGSSKENSGSKERNSSKEHSISKEHSSSKEQNSSKEHNSSREHSTSKEHSSSKEHSNSKEHNSSKEHSGSKEHSNSKERISSRTSKSSESKSKERDKDKESNERRSSKDKHKEKSKDKKEITSSSSRSKPSSASVSTEEKHKHSSSGSSNSTSKVTSKRTESSSKDKHATNSTTPTKHKDHKSKDRKRESAHSSKKSADAQTLDTDGDELFATTEEDIMKECEMIYDQLEQEFATLHQNTTQQEEKNTEKQAELKRKASLDAEQAADLALQKKRVAYENADKNRGHTLVAPHHKPNHIRNAMQAIYDRQSMVRKQQADDAASAASALRDAEEKVREANEALRKVKEKNLTPLIPKSFLTPPTKLLSRSIAPVANMLALERAKKKVEELRAEKKPAFTPAQTTRGVGRVAHKATAATAAVVAEEPEKQAKPPVLESKSTKISFNIRMQYYELMVKHCLAIYPNLPDAWERAQTEELTVFKKCNTPVIYKSSALLAINKLRKEAADSGNKPACSNRMVSHEVILAGKMAQNTSWSVQKKMKTDSTVGGEPFDKLPADKAYEMIYELRLTEELLISNGYPRAGKRAGTAIITNWKPMRRPNDVERYCSRCGKVFNMSMYDEVYVDECNYHPKSTGYRRGFADNQHRCCQQPAGTAGCTYANYHVSDYFDAENLTGYVSTIDKDEDYVSTKKDIYALDCEMCYTTHGIELTRVTVVDINSRTVYDALVKPDNKIVDYNTVYSGITEQMLANESRTLRDVQAILMSMFHSKTVLVGHSLESDLKALKLIHTVVVDTSVLFPHKMGPPKKRALKTLCIENLKRIIQENEAGHDSAEDAEVCIQLVKFYLRNKIS